MDKKRTFGRIEWIEPNDLENSSNGIPQPYENYNIYVDLEVFLPERSNCGMAGGGTVLNYSTSNGTLSFMNGTNGKLTTNYTDIKLNGRPEENTSECLGIESIHLTYDKNMIPIADVKFIDIRGASFFSQQEKFYVESLRNGSKEYSAQYGTSFMKAVFSMPSPIFTMTIKGFYGKPVSFKFDRNAPKVNFNPETGNFEVDIQFIGQMFGVYADLPMVYTLLAPYMSYHGIEHWNNNKNTTFVYGDTGAPMKTFVEFRSLISTFMKNDNKDGENNDNKKNLQKHSKYSTDAGKICADYRALLEAISVWSSGNKDYCYPNEGFELKESWYNFIVLYNDTISTSVKDKKLINSLRKELSNEVKLFCGNYEGKIDYKLGEFTGDTTDQKLNIGENEFKIKVSKREGTTYITDEKGDSLDVILENDDAINYIRKIVNTEVEKRGNNVDFTLKFLMIYDANFLKNINDSKKAEDDKIQEINKVINTWNSEETIKLLGFRPTVWNYFKMVFAHMETFIYSYYSCLNEISDSRRTSRSLGLMGVRTDIPKCQTDQPNCFIPPFPLIFRPVSNNNGTIIRDEIVKPGETYNGGYSFDSNNFDEIKLVDSIFDAINNYVDKEKEIDKMMAESLKATAPINIDSSVYIPTTMFDVMSTKENPYINVITPYMDDIQEFVDTYFLLRAFQYEMYVPIPDLKFMGNKGGLWNSTNVKHRTEIRKKRSKGFGMFEAINFFRAHPKKTKAIQKYLDSNRSFDFSYGRLQNKKDNTIWNYKNVKNSIALYSGKDINNTFFFYDGDPDEGIYFPLKIKNFADLGYRLQDAKEDITDTNKEYWVNIKDPSKNRNCVVINERDIILELNEQINSNKFMLGLENTGLNIDGMKAKDKISYFTYNDNYLDEDANKMFPHIFDGGESHYGVYGKVWKADREIWYKDDVGKIPFISLVKIWENYKVSTSDNPCICLDSIYKESVEYYKKNPTKDIKSADILSRMYMLLWSIPFYSGIYDFISFNTRLKLDLLQEGAFWWRAKFIEDNEFDPIHLNEKYRSPGKYDFFRFRTDSDVVYGGFNLIVDKISENTTSPQNYKSLDKPESYSIGRREALEKYFIDWVNEGNISLLSNLEDGNSMSYISPDEIDEELRVSIKKNKLNGRFKSYIKTENYQKLQGPLKELLFKCNFFVDFSKFESDYGEDSYNDFTRKRRNDVKYAFDSFKSTLKTLYSNQSVEENEKAAKENEYKGYSDQKKNDLDFKLQIYLSLKRMYDRHFCGESATRWVLPPEGEKNSNSDFSQFLFVDTYYNDIKDAILLGTKDVFGALSGMVADSASSTEGNPVGSEGNPNTTVEQFLSIISQKSGIAVKAFPLGNALLHPKDIRDMFRATPNYTKDDVQRNFFICIYNDEMSSNLNIEDSDGSYQYAQDGFDIADSAGNPSPTIPEALCTENGYHIPAFGVSFGKQNQSYFYGFTMNADVYKSTEPAIQAKFDIARKGSEGPRETNLYGQNIYSVYSNLSYQVTVTGMGNLQIMPFMMFQLNNIPMFKGAYLIQKVDHTITPGNIETSFVGTRIKRYSVPIVKDSMIFADLYEGSNLVDPTKLASGNYKETIEKYSGQIINTQNGIDIKMVDFMRSNTASSRNISNTPTPEHERNLIRMAKELLSPLFYEWQQHCMKNTIHGNTGWKNTKVYITSGYRSGSLNKDVGGSSASAHCGGNAADLVPANGKVTEFYEFIKKFFMKRNDISFDQLLNETTDSGSHWVHIGYYSNGGLQRREWFYMHNHKRRGEKNYL